MQISTPALLKLAVFLLASPGIVTAGVVPLSVNPLACTDLIWDEHDTGFQSRICTIPHPSITQDGAQALISRRVFEEVSEEFPSVFSTHTPITTETGMDSCAPFANTIAPSNEEQSDDTSESIPSKSTIQRRGACASRKQSLPYRTPLTSSEEAHSKSWCFRPGPSPNRNDITSLCRNIAQMAAPGSHGMPNNPFHDDFVVQRARGAAPGNATVENGGSCVCVAGRERTAGFKVCNCDRCDALVINRGLADMCKSLQERCTSKGFSSGYIKSALRSTMSNSIVSLFTFPSSKGGKNQPMELDPNLAKEGVVVGSCRSENENRKGQDYSGPVIDCNAFFVGRFAGGRWCKDMVVGGERKWVKEKEDPFVVLRGKKKEGGFSQYSDK